MKRWTEKEDKILEKMYRIESYENISKRLERSYSAIGQRVFALGLKQKKGRTYLPRRKYNIDRNYFDKITIETCTLAGLIAADGNIVENKNGIKIALKEKDGKILEKWAQIVGYDGPVAMYQNGKTAYNHKGSIDLYTSMEFLNG